MDFKIPNIKKAFLITILLKLILLTLTKHMKKSNNNISEKNIKKTFELSDTNFLLNGNKFQIISGEMHYPRIPQAAWRHRFKMARAMGLNTISTYIFWNMHQPEKNIFNFEGNNNIREFIKTAQEEGLFVILRPSPYVCAEWEFGGYPYWLLNEQNLEVRSKNENYLNLYREYIRKIGEQLADLQIHKSENGNIILIQLENEYGSYGADKAYLEINKRIFNEAGFDGVLITCDPKEAIENGHLPGVLPAINGVDDPAEVFSLIKQNNNNKGPFLIAEWYPAWFDNWGYKHQTKSVAEYALKLDRVLQSGISINMYMFHGGTTTGFRNGANYGLTNPTYEPQITSYDYDAPLDEAGNPTAKFFAFREVIRKYLPEGSVLPDVPAKKEALAIQNILFGNEIQLFERLEQFEKYAGAKPLNYEQVGLDYGYLVYKTTIKAQSLKAAFDFSELNNSIFIEGVRDYVHVYLEGNFIGKLDRRLKEDTIKFSAMHLNSNSKNKADTDDSLTLVIIAENMGRINFGEELLHNNKGIIGDVKLNGNVLEKWETYKISLDSLRDLQDKKQIGFENLSASPVLFKGSFNLEKVGDTYLDFTEWGKGAVWINGNNIGRYWFIGPQQTLYVPGEFLRVGENEIILFEMLRKGEQLNAIDNPILDHLQ